MTGPCVLPGLQNLFGPFSAESTNSWHLDGRDVISVCRLVGIIKTLNVGPLDFTNSSIYKKHGVANLLDDNLVHYIFFQFSGIESAGKRDRKVEKSNAVCILSWLFK